MNGNTEMLNFVFQNSQMGVDTIKQLMGIVEDEDFKKVLESQYKEYKEISTAVRTELNNSGQDEKGLGTLEKIRTYLMINMQTLTNKTPSHIAEMMIIGSNMGIIDAIKNLKRYKYAEKNVIGLMERLLKFEEENVNQLKQYL